MGRTRDCYSMSCHSCRREVEVVAEPVDRGGVAVCRCGAVLKCEWRQAREEGNSGPPSVARAQAPLGGRSNLWRSRA